MDFASCELFACRPLRRHDAKSINFDPYFYLSSQHLVTRERNCVTIASPGWVKWANSEKRKPKGKSSV